MGYGHLPRAQVGAPLRQPLKGVLDNGLNLFILDAAWCATARQVGETFHAAMLEPLAQGADGVGAQSHFSGNSLIAFALVHEQQRPCSFGFRSWRVTLSPQAFQELTLTCLKLDLHNWTTTKKHAQFLPPHTIYVDNLHDMTLRCVLKLLSQVEDAASDEDEGHE